MEDFKLRRLQRQRRRRRNTARILNHEELAQLFNVAEDSVKQVLIDAGWDFHEDARGRLWVSVDTADSLSLPITPGAN